MLKYDQLIVAEGDYMIAHGRPASWVAADIVRIEDGKLAEHWDVLQDEATKAQIRQWAVDVRRRLPRLTFGVPQEARRHLPKRS